MFKRKHQHLTVRIYFLTIILLLQNIVAKGQFTPIALSGFSQDVIAEAGPSPLATTTMEIDGLTSSNKVMYSSAFAAFASIAVDFLIMAF